MDPLGLTLAVGAAVAAGVVAYFLGRRLGRRLEQGRQQGERDEARDEASLIRKDAEEKAEDIRRSAELAAREESLRLRESWKAEESRRRDKVEQGERRLRERSETADRKADQLDRKADQLDRREELLNDRSQKLDSRDAETGALREETDRLLAQTRERLETVAGLSADDAKAELVSGLEDEARAEAANTIRAVKDEAQRTADREAKRLVAMAIQRMAADETAQLTVSVVQLPSDEMKGRIIGREGRNIRAFELATGIDVVVDDTPEAVVLSGYDPVRREIARVALCKLVEDGRIHPGRIEDVVADSRREVEDDMRATAEEVLYELGIHGVHKEVVKVLGRLKFRTSYGQNQLAHSREVALLAGSMAAEMGLDAKMARRAGLLHDVGKGVPQDQEGTHVELGYRLCKRYGEPDVVLNAIKAHHDEMPHESAEAWLVTAADAISGSRPGARREMFEGYVKRLEKLEEIAVEQPGVDRCFAIQAGRELRIMVRPEHVSDDDMARISEAVARKIENELQYPGQIKVVVIRETRTVDFAR